MRALLPLSLLLFASFAAGCAGVPGIDAGSCPQLDGRATIQEVSGNDLRVRIVSSGETAILHVGSAQLYRRDPDGCVAITVGEVSTGSNVAFHVDEWATSYPVQGWPKQVVVG
ncbi:MAG: hypothetical protein QOG31_1167 [Thermoplasmata archaeon]|jgi:hypothetical protein|nr:hypothetical protein [Thermoplasmata archaeon]